MVRISRILCPVDFSNGSRRALDQAVGLASWYGATVGVLYVHRLTVPPSAIGMLTDAQAIQPVGLTDAERAEARRLLDDLAAPGRKAGLAIETLLDEDLDVPGAIAAQAEGFDADLVVLGTHGRSGVRRLVLGSVAEKVLRLAARPVMVVPPRAAGAAPRAIQRIVCAVDLSPASGGALEYATSLATQTGARLTVIHVVELLPESAEYPLIDLTAYRMARFAEARRGLGPLVPAALRARGTVDELILAGTPYVEILRLAGEQRADLIVMGVQGRGAIDLAFFGSTAQHVVRQAECPVLTIRA